MTAEEYQRRLDECLHAWESASALHRESVYFVLLRRTDEIVRYKNQASADGLRATNEDLGTYAEVLIGAAIELGWDGGSPPQSEEDTI